MRITWGDDFDDGEYCNYGVYDDYGDDAYSVTT